VRLTKLRVFQFRNLADQELFLSPDTNLFVGPNGHGKTNLLESIYLLGFGKSFRTALPRECIRQGKSQCRIEGTVEHGSISKQLKVSIGAGEKTLFLHGKPVTLDQFAGNVHILAFAQEHLKIVRGTPGERRSFLDRAMITLYPGHIRHLSAYQRALRQRNKILSEGRSRAKKVDESILDSWDETMVREGAPIVCNRSRYVERMKEKLPQGLFDRELFSISYLSSMGMETADLKIVEDEFRHMLLKARQSDLRLGFTSIGPHRDDLKLYVNSMSLADFGSAGQQRSCLLCLYFAQMEIHRSSHGFYPVFLVDDFEAELDDRRLHTFLRYLSQRTQVFLTTAKSAFSDITPEGTRRFHVDSGTVLPAD